MIAITDQKYGQTKDSYAFGSCSDLDAGTLIPILKKYKTENMECLDQK